MNVVFLKIKTTMYFYLKYLIISIVVNVVDVVSVFCVYVVLGVYRPLKTRWQIYLPSLLHSIIGLYYREE